MKFGFIGAGKVGFSIGKYLAINNQDVVGYYSEFEEDAREAAEFTQSHCYSDLNQLVQDSQVIFITVPDGVIEKVWNQIKIFNFSEKIICHTSGALSSEVFSDISEHNSFGFSIHPLFAVSDKYNSYKELSHSFFTIEGSKEKVAEMKSLFEGFGNTVCVIEKENKVKYHAAAAIASNLVVGLMDISSSLLKECGFGEEEAANALKPIATSNMEKIFKVGAVDALTGPVERADISTIKKHLDVIEGNCKDAYLALSKQILEIAKVKNNERDYSELEEILK